MESVVAATYLYACASVFLLIYTKCKVKSLKKALFKEELPSLCIFGAFGTFSYNLMGMIALKFLGAQQCSVINYSWPIFVVILTCIFFKHRFTGWTAVAIILSMVGVILVIGIDGQAVAGEKAWRGVFLSIGGAFLYAAFCVWNTRIRTDKFVAMTIYYIVATVLSLIVILIRGYELTIPTGITIPIILWNGMLVYGFASALWAKALDVGNPILISNLAYLTPVVALVWVRLLLRQRIMASAVGGLILVLMGIAVQAFGEHRANRKYGREMR